MKNKILIAFLLMVSILLGSCNINKVPNEDAESIDTTASTIEQTSPEIQTLEPDETIVETPAETTSEKPTETTSEEPAETTSEMPAETTSEIPAETTSEMPAETTSEEPAETTSEEPAETTSEEPAETTSEEPVETTSDVPEETEPQDDEAEDNAYLDIPIQKPRGYMSKVFGIGDSAISFKMKFYLDWEYIKNDDGGYSILSKGVEIGRVISGEADDITKWKTIYQKDAVPGIFQVTEFLEKSGTGETLRFRHRYCYRYIESGQERVITLTIAYGEIDNYVQTQLREKAVYQEHHTDPMYGSLSYLQDQPIIVLGNSFISTSRIGHIYNDIAESSGKSPAMTAISRGYASISTYAQDSALLKRIANGEWAAVFLCGFYGQDTTSVGIIKNACDKSNTQLIIFPAHNESDQMRINATSKYPELICINWKREIDQLINEGRSKWDFCIDDEHSHSTPLAGYVGAMMIWRAIWGEMPDVTLTYGMIDQEWADSLLGSYLESPTFKLMDTKGTFFLE